MSSSKNTIEKSKNKNDSPCVPSKLKVELQTLRISEESERQLYETLKHIYGSVRIYIFIFPILPIYVYVLLENNRFLLLSVFQTF